MEQNMNRSWFDRRKKCPTCGSDKFRTIYQSQYDEPPIKDYLLEFYSQQGQGPEFEYLKGAKYILCECDICGLIFQLDIPNKTLMERLYNQWLAPGNFNQQKKKKDNLEYYSSYAQEVMTIISYFRKAPSSLCFFDFGMGWGKWALMAKAFGCDSYGTELSSDRIKYAKSNGIKVIMWDDIPKHSFDFINTEQVFEHIPEPLLTIRHLQKALKPNGILKISVPTANDIDQRLKIMDWKIPKGSKKSLNPVAPLEHINYFRRKSLIKMASEAGMEEVFIPTMLQYRHVTNWGNPKRVAKNIILPLYRNLLKKKNYILLRNIQQNKD